MSYSHTCVTMLFFMDPGVREMRSITTMSYSHTCVTMLFFVDTGVREMRSITTMSYSHTCVTMLFFMDPGVKVNGKYCYDVLLSHVCVCHHAVLHGPQCEGKREVLLRCPTLTRVSPRCSSWTPV